MERQLVASRKVQQVENKKKLSVDEDEDEYCARKHVSDIESEKEDEVDQSCLTEEDGYLSDHNSEKRTREAVTTRYDGTSYADEWLGYLVPLISKRSQLSRMMLKT